MALDLVVYAQVRHFDFVQLDDPGYFAENAHVRAGLTAAGIRWAMTTGALANWHPLTWLSLMLDAQLFGAGAGAVHVTNLALHIANTVLLFALLRRLTGALGRSACVAALFAVHPMHVESVAWISERKDVLSTLFWLLTMWAYVSYARTPNGRRYAVVAGLFALGLMAKPMLVTLPVVLLVVDWWPLGRLSSSTWRARVVEKLPLAAIAAASAIVTFVVQRQGGAVSDVAVLPWAVRITHAVVSYGMYIDKMLWPAKLIVFYPHPRVVEPLATLIALVVLAAWTVIARKLGPRFPYVAAGWLWYVITLLPVIGLIQVGTQSIADRYTYVPYIGLFIVIAWGVWDLCEAWPIRRVVLPLTAAIVVAALAVTAHAQTATWRDNTTLWRHAIEVDPENYRAQSAYGSILGNEGKPAEAMAHFQEAIRLEPDFADAYYNLGRTYTDLGRTDEAIEQYRRALALRSDFAEAHNNLGLLLGRIGQPDQATAEYEAALRQNPDFAEAHANLAAVLATRGQLDDARRHADAAVALNPSLAGAHYARGLVAMGSGQFDAAIAEFRDAIRLNPNLADAHNSLGFLLAGQRSVDEAIPQFREAIRLNPDLELGHMYLAVALAGTGHFDEAEAEFRTVLRINPANEGAARGLETIARMRKGR